MNYHYRDRDISLAQNQRVEMRSAFLRQPLTPERDLVWGLWPSEEFESDLYDDPYEGLSISVGSPNQRLMEY